MKDSTVWFWKYKLLDLEIKGLNNAWKILDIPWHVISRIDNRRVKGLAWDDPKATAMYRRAVKACDTQIERTRRLIPMANRRSKYYLEYLKTK